jgi:hypothetical protein
MHLDEEGCAIRNDYYITTGAGLQGKLSDTSPSFRGKEVNSSCFSSNSILLELRRFVFFSSPFLRTHKPRGLMDQLPLAAMQPREKVLPVHDTAHHAFMTLPAHTRQQRERGAAGWVDIMTCSRSLPARSTLPKTSD